MIQDPVQTKKVPFPLLRLDPTQNSLREHFYARQNLVLRVEEKEVDRVIELLSQLVVDSLLAGQNMVILAEDPTYLDRINTRLQELKLDNYSLLVQHIDQDYLPVQQAIGEGKERALRPILIPATRQKPDRQLLSIIQALDHNYRQSRQAIFGARSWFDILGNWLSINRQNPRILIDSRLDPKSFQFDPTEFTDLLDTVGRLQTVYQKVGTLHHPLRHLKAAIFVHFSEEEAFLFVDLKVEHFLARFTDLFHRLISFRTRYADHLLLQWEKTYQNWQQELAAVSELTDAAIVAVGQDYLNSKSISLQMSGLLSAKSRAGLRYKRQIEKQYLLLQNKWKRHSAFVHRLPDWKQGQPLRQLQNIVQEFGLAWQAWYDRKEERLRDELNRLNHKTALSAFSRADELNKLEESFDALVDLLNETELLELPLRATMLTLDKRLRLLEDTIAQLSEIQHNLPDFASFYHWQKSIVEQTEARRRLVVGLARARSRDWCASFQAWYWHECLRQNLRSAADTSTQELNGLVAGFKQYSGAVWQLIQQDFFSKKQRRKKRKKNRQEPKAEQWWPAAIQELDKRFPIWMTRPAILGELFQKKKLAFEQIIYLGSQQQAAFADLISGTRILHSWVNPDSSSQQNASESFSDFIQLSSFTPVNLPKLESNAFYEELALRLQAQYPAAKIATAESWGTLHLPLVIYQTQKPHTIVLADGFLAETSSTNMQWEAVMQDELISQGYRLISTSTQLWWQDTKAAWQQLITDLAQETSEEE